jgi:ADP-ribosylglycohydrolase
MVNDRILGCLQGLAVGDAVGKQSETLAYADVARWYPEGIRGFEGTPGDVIPRYAANNKRKWRIGETTDDSERTIAVAGAILDDDGAVRHATVGRHLLACTKCVHPGVKSLWEFHQAADPTRVTRDYDGCGAAVRVAPVGILFRPGDIRTMVAAAREASISTHGGPLALAGAAATAAAVSAAIEGLPPDTIVTIAQQAAAQAETERRGAPADLLARAIGALYESIGGLKASSALAAEEIAARHFPDNPLTIVPLAIALASVEQSASSAILLAANVGGDSDSVASIAGAVLGARHPETVNDDWCAIVERVNGHGLKTWAERLRALRRSDRTASATDPAGDLA